MDENLSFRQLMDKSDAFNRMMARMTPRKETKAFVPKIKGFKSEMTYSEFLKREIGRKDIRRARIWGRGKADRMNEVREKEKNNQLTERG